MDRLTLMPVHNAAIDGFIEQWLSFDCADSRLTAVCTFNMQSDSFVNNAFHHVSVLENVSMLARNPCFSLILSVSEPS